MTKTLSLNKNWTLPHRLHMVTHTWGKTLWQWLLLWDTHTHWHMTYIACMTRTEREREMYEYIYIQYRHTGQWYHMHRILDEEIVPTMPCPACSRKLRIMVRHDPLPAGGCAPYCLHKNCTTAHFAFGAAWLTVVLCYVYIYTYTHIYIYNQIGLCSMSAMAESGHDREGSW
jgi:hypothetical protein